MTAKCASRWKRLEWLVIILGICFRTPQIYSSKLESDAESRGFKANVTDTEFKMQRLKKKKTVLREQNPYQTWENVVRKNSLKWEEFRKIPKATTVRNRQIVRPSILNSLIECPSSASGVTVTAASCNEQWGETFISAWKNRKVKEDLCEENAYSKINCYDSPIGKSRMCVFENAMMTFKKMRKRKQAGEMSRSWERGFLSADCGYMGKDDIGYSLLYKPDVEGGEEAVCDYTFNETVLVYSHENTRNYGQMLTDYMNVWSMLWVVGASADSRDITFLNIDSLGQAKKGKYTGDAPNVFFKNYDVSFRRVLRAIDFAEPVPSKVCFKKVIMPPRPVVLYQASSRLPQADAATASMGLGTGDLPLCAHHTAPSSLFQRMNIQVRNNYGLLASQINFPTAHTVQVLLLIRSLKDPSSKVATPPPERDLSRLLVNQQELIDSLQQLADRLAPSIAANHSPSTTSSPDKDRNKLVSNGRFGGFNVVVKDFATLAYNEQVCAYFGRRICYLSFLSINHYKVILVLILFLK